MTMPDPAERARRIAQEAASRVDNAYIAREWWRVTRSGEPSVEVFFCPPQSHAEVLGWPRYHGCGVIAIA